MQYSTGSWVYRYMIAGRSRAMGLGPLRQVSLGEARILAAEARELARQGIDPLDYRRGELAGATTFGQAVDAYLAAHGPGWRNAKHAQQWHNTLVNGWVTSLLPRSIPRRCWRCCNRFGI